MAMTVRFELQTLHAMRSASCKKTVRGMIEAEMSCPVPGVLHLPIQALREARRGQTRQYIDKEGNQSRQTCDAILVQLRRCK
jgi:hypothetical protein